MSARMQMYVLVGSCRKAILFFFHVIHIALEEHLETSILSLSMIYRESLPSIKPYLLACQSPSTVNSPQTFTYSQNTSDTRSSDNECPTMPCVALWPAGKESGHGLHTTSNCSNAASYLDSCPRLWLSACKEKYAKEVQNCTFPEGDPDPLSAVLTPPPLHNCRTFNRQPTPRTAH
jgi:hypothetical protein